MPSKLRFLVILLYLVLLSLCQLKPLSWELRDNDNGVVKKIALLTVKPQSQVRILIYRTWTIIS